MRKIFVLVFLTALACNKENEFKCVQYYEDVKIFCKDASKLSKDMRIRSQQLSICNDEQLRKELVCTKWAK